MPYSPLMTKLFHILVEEVLSFDLHGLTSKIGQELPSENKQNVRQTSNAHISEMRQDIKISSTYLESVANFTSDRDLDDLVLFKIIYLWHEGSMIGVQCQWMIL